MGNNGVKSISLTDFSVSSWANTSGWLEEFVITKSKLLACNRTDHTLDIYDVQTGVKEGKINLVKDPESLVAVDDNIYVLSTGGWSTNEQELAAIQKINLNDFSVRVEYKFSNINHSPTRLRLDTNASKLFYINNAVFEYNLLSKEEPKQLFKRSNDILYGLAIHPISGSIYTTGANNYVEQGSVYCLNPDGTLKKEYQAGIIPSFMACF
jgi:outer membrane protein assembly factor BamB